MLVANQGDGIVDGSLLGSLVVKTLGLSEGKSEEVRDGSFEGRTLDLSIGETRDPVEGTPVGCFGKIEGEKARSQIGDSHTCWQTRTYFLGCLRARNL